MLGDPRTAAQRTDAVESTDLCTAKDRVGAQITLEKPGCAVYSTEPREGDPASNRVKNIRFNVLSAIFRPAYS